MSDFNITSRYSNALIALSEEKNTFSRAAADIELIFNTLKDSRDLRLMLSSPVIKSVKKIEILTEIFSAHVSQDTLNYIIFIVNKKREDLLFKILYRFLQLKDEKLGLINIDVKSAAKFDEIQMDAMKVKLADYTQKKVRIDFSVEENLIGGFVAKVGDTVLDGSVKQQLKNLKKQLLA
jgi:F-type H+-transporting ATPase subunit delta